MGVTVFKTAVVAAAAVLPGASMAVVVPPLLAGLLARRVILSAWVLYERQTQGARRGLCCIALGIVPGVAVGFATCLLLRVRQNGSDPA